jgi:RNA processing factor Prp31
MIVQAIGLLDDLDKELNTYAMRVREWYGWHFPELTKIIQDNIQYARSVKLMGDRINAAKLDFSEVKIQFVSYMPIGYLLHYMDGYHTNIVLIYSWQFRLCLYP